MFSATRPRQAAIEQAPDQFQIRNGSRTLVAPYCRPHLDTQVAAVRNVRRQGIAATAISVVDIAVWDLCVPGSWISPCCRGLARGARQSPHLWQRRFYGLHTRCARRTTERLGRIPRRVSPESFTHGSPRDSATDSNLANLAVYDACQGSV